MATTTVFHANSNGASKTAAPTERRLAIPSSGRPPASFASLQPSFNSKLRPGEHTMPHDRFDHVFVEPSSFEASLAFYRDALGCGEPRGASLTSSDMRIVLAEPHPAQDKSKSHGING